MAESQDENAFPLQIRHDVDGWFFQPKEYNKEGNAWLYECPKCQSQIIVTPYVTDSVSVPQDVPSSTESQHQDTRKRSARKQEHHSEVQSVESEQPTDQES